MKFVLVLTTVLVAVSAVPHPRMVQQEWNSFKSNYAKIYDNADEEAKRLAIFQQNLIKIEEHNKLYEQGLSSFEMGVTLFADMTSEEFMAYVNKSVVPSRPKVRGEKVVASSASAPPKSVDWRTKNILTPVKNQGKCESGYAFAVTGALEAHYALATGKVISLSEQQLIDCWMSYDDTGCNGGYILITYGYLSLYNLSYEHSYPYKGKKGACHDGEPSPVQISDLVEIVDSHEEFCNAVAHGPVSTTVVVTEKWHLYKGGVLEDASCKLESANHGVLIVGYNETDQYYIIKNSFGSSWGEDGYIRLSYKSPCAVEESVLSPKVQKS